MSGGAGLRVSTSSMMMTIRIQGRRMKKRLNSTDFMVRSSPASRTPLRGERWRTPGRSLDGGSARTQEAGAGAFSMGSEDAAGAGSRGTQPPGVGDPRRCREARATGSAGGLALSPGPGESAGSGTLSNRALLAPELCRAPGKR